MAKIKEVVKISGGYTDVVDLTQQFSDPEANSQLMEKYRPIKAHRDAFAELANSLNQKDKRFYFLSGSYGTGKSHLCLMAANYFANSSLSPEMSAFFQNYKDAQQAVKLKPGEQLDETLAAVLQARRNEGAFLVAICRHGLNLEFEGTILRALQEALAGTGVELNTHFNEAVRKIQQWDKDRQNRPHFKNLVEYLDSNHKGLTVEELIKGLRENREESFKIFKDSFSEITTADFTFSRDNLLDILKDVLSDDNFKSKFRGLLIIYDEFGYALDDNNVRLSEMQEFAQFCANSNQKHLPVIFIGTGHKAFRNHGNVGDAVHYDTIVDRVKEVGLQTQGMEDIIGAIVSPETSHPAWENEIASKPAIFQSLVAGANRLNLFNWLRAPVLENNIVRNIYPLHPLATFALLHLAREVGAENRSLFRFFSPKVDPETGEWVDIDKFSYPWFVSENNISSPGGLNLYTMDLLSDYFKDGLSSDNKKLNPNIRQSLKNFEESLRFLNNYVAREFEEQLLKKEDLDDLFIKVLKTILIFESVSSERLHLPATFENICFALNAVSKIEKDSVESRLSLLEKINVISVANKVYELRKSDAKDIQRLVDDLKADPKNHPASLLDAFLKYRPLTPEEKFIEAKDYNTTFSEDKRLLTLLVNPSQLEQKSVVKGVELNFFEKCVADRVDSLLRPDGYDGTAVFVFCQSDDQISEAKRMLKISKCVEVVSSVPVKPSNILNDILTLIALDIIKASADYNNFSTLEIAQFNEISRNALNSLDAEKEKWFNNKNLVWFTVDGNTLQVNASKQHDIANKIIENKFSSFRNKKNFPDFSKSHINISSSNKRILNEAIETLMDLSRSIVIENGLPDNRGAVKYLSKCFVNNQVIRFIKEENNKRYFEPETDRSKFVAVFPAYEVMLRDIESSAGKGWLNFNSFIRPYYEKYGLGQISLILFFLLARRTFGDSLRLKKNAPDYVDLNFNDASVPFSLISMEYKDAVFKYEPVSAEQKNYYTILYNIFNSASALAGNVYTLVEAHSAISDWWRTLPNLVKIPSFCNKDLTPLHKLFLTAQSADPYTFIKKNLMEALGLEENELLNRSKIESIRLRLTGFKNFVEELEESKKNSIREKLKEMFNAETLADLDLFEAIRGWHNSLDKHQRDHISSFHDNDSKPLVKRINSVSNQSEFIFNILPSDYGLGSVISWESDKTVIFIDKIRSGKKKIEENASRVGGVSIQPDNSANMETNFIRHKGGFDITVTPENNDDVIYFTEDGSDPSDEKSQRKKIKKNEKISVKGNKTIRFVVQEPGGQYGAPRSYTVIDESDKCRIQRAHLGFKGEEQITFIFPADPKDVEISLKSFINEIINSNVITKKDLDTLLKKIMKEVNS